MIRRLLIIGDGSERGLRVARALSHLTAVTLFSPAAATNVTQELIHPEGWREVRGAVGASSSATLNLLAAAAGTVVHLGLWASEMVTEGAQIYAPERLAVCVEAKDTVWRHSWRLERKLVTRARVLVTRNEDRTIIALLYGVNRQRIAVGDIEETLHLTEEAGIADEAPLALALNDYPVAGRDSGGAFRTRGMLNLLRRPVLLLSWGERTSCHALGDEAIELVVHKSAMHRAVEIDAARFAPAIGGDVITAVYASGAPGLEEVLEALAMRISLLLFEHCYLATLLPQLRRAGIQAPVVYHAHNVEVALKRAVWEGCSYAGMALELVERLETGLLAEAALAIACSEQDAAALRPAGGAILMIPHLALQEQRALPQQTSARMALAGFVGSYHPPNLDAVRFIALELAPTLPQVEFQIVGGAGLVLHEAPENVKVLGVLDTATLAEAMRGWTVALNPVDWGGGASVKMADYIAAGLPCLSTYFGLRGLNEDAAEAVCAATLPEFTKALKQLMADSPRRAAMIDAGRRAMAAMRTRSEAALNSALAGLKPTPSSIPVMPALMPPAGEGHALEAARTAAQLKLNQPYLLMAGNGIPPVPDELRTALRGRGIALVLSDGTQAWRIGADGEHSTTRIALPRLLCPACVGVFLLDDLPDTNALIAAGWSCGIPVIAGQQNQRAVAMIKHGVNGWLSKNPDTDIEHWHDEETVRQRLIKGGRKSLHGQTS